MHSKARQHVVNGGVKGRASDKGDLLHATYGDDSCNPLLWHLINLRSQLELCGGNKLPKGSLALAQALFSRATSLGLHHRWFALGFFDAAAKAVLDGDADFFREVARLLEQRISGGIVERRIDVAVHSAVNRLRSLTGLLPTKRQVREDALELLAWHNAINRLGPQFSITDVFDNFWDEKTGRPRVKKSLADAVKKELERLPAQNWTKIFKRCGLSHLPHDRGGQPSHSKRPYCRLDS